MKEQFKDFNFRADRLAMIDLANEIISIYRAQDLRLTLRQLYYQFITRNALPNREQSYDKLGTLISDARLAGLIDWESIEDRVRIPSLPREFKDLKNLVDTALYSYRLPRWEGQEKYIELWVEKDALSGVLAPVATQYHITLMVNRGYSSQSAMYEASRRFIYEGDKECHLFYLGDHDPSGEDMVRDVQDRLNMFGAEVEVTKIALTMEQVQKYNPPPNPAKLTDSRANNYIAKFGNESWEVDALPPEALRTLITDTILEHLNVDKMNAIITDEKRDKVELTKATEEILNRRQ